MPRNVHVFWSLCIHGYAFSHQECVRRRAILSVRANPACPDQATAERAVNEVWESCFNDTRPFDEVSERSEMFGVVTLLTMV